MKSCCLPSFAGGSDRTVGHLGMTTRRTGGRLLDQPRILIVDDEPFNLDLLEQELELLGYESLRAVDGRNALEKLACEAFDLVLLDVMMPGIDGYGVLERMKSNPKWRNIPVIMISALTDMASIVRCIS